MLMIIYVTLTPGTYQVVDQLQAESEAAGGIF
jgi:hypothetical protein